MLGLRGSFALDSGRGNVKTVLVRSFAVKRAVVLCMFTNCEPGRRLLGLRGSFALEWRTGDRRSLYKDKLGSLIFVVSLNSGLCSCGQLLSSSTVLVTGFAVKPCR